MLAFQIINVNKVPLKDQEANIFCKGVETDASPEDLSICGN